MHCPATERTIERTPLLTPSCRPLPFLLPFFFLLRHGIVEALIERLRDGDSTTKKFAAFAVGNAAFHSSLLVPPLVEHGVVPALEELLGTRDCEINAAGALCNLAKYDARVKAGGKWREVKAILQKRMKK